MKKSYQAMGLAFCLLSLALAGSVLATPSKTMPDSFEEQPGRSTEKDDRERDCHLFLVSGDLVLEPASLDAGKPINTFHLFIAGADGKIIRNAQVITTFIDRQGNQQSACALPFKGGYTVAIHHLPPGPYAVEAEIVAGGRLLTDRFRFSRA